MSTANLVQPPIGVTTPMASQLTHTRQQTQPSMDPIHSIAESLDARDWDAVMVLYYAWLKTVRLQEKEKKEREQAKRILSDMGPEEHRLRQLVANELVVLSKSKPPRKARSSTRKTTGTKARKAKAHLVPSPAISVSTPGSASPVARGTRSRSLRKSSASSTTSTSGSSHAP